MHATRISFIHELTHREPAAWEELDECYRPLIRKWLGRFPLQASDAEDLTQDVMAVLLRDIQNFHHNGRVGAFRNWLRTTSINLTRNYLRRKGTLEATGASVVYQMLLQLEDRESQAALAFDLEHSRLVVRRLLKSVSKQFEPITLDIFRMHVIDGVKAAETARRLGVSVASVHTAKSRVLRRLRREAPDYLREMD